jgi:hypothetical protein
MIRLKGAYRGERAAVIFGGPSLLAHGFDFARLRERGFVTFLETKALTPRFVAAGLVPDYFLMLFPEKSKDNALQHFVYRSFLAEYRIDSFLRPAYRPVVAEMRAAFNDNFEFWRPHRGPHKKYRWRPGVYLRDSPYDLLPRIAGSRLIVNRQLAEHYFPGCRYSDRSYYFGTRLGEPAFDIDKYFNPVEEDGIPNVRCADTFSNSAAISLYPLLHYLGFRDVYFLGMDMSIVGSFEYSAPFTFQSMAHYWWFLKRNERVFNGNPKVLKGGWLFSRPTSEFEAVRALWKESPVRFTQVHEPFRWAWPIGGVPTMSYTQLLAA